MSSTDANDSVLAPGEEPYSLRFDHPDPTYMPRIHPDLTATGGVIRTICEDFDVQEIPLYAFSGEGEHLYITARKTNRTTLQARDHLARHFGVRPDDVGFAGFKDKRAVAEQTFSVPTAKTATPAELDQSWFEVVSVTRHRNKLRTGHLAGNRFRIRIREVEESVTPAATEMVARIERDGLPNIYGPQRFGIHSLGNRVGAALLRRDVKRAVELLVFPQPEIDETFRTLVGEGKYEDALEALPPGRSCEAALLHGLRRHPGNFRAAARRIPRQLRKMYYSAYQSELFNWVLRERLEWGGGALSTLRQGDLAYIHGKGAVFLVEDVETERARAESFEVSPSGPMFGRKIRFSEGEMGLLERTVLEAEGLRPASFVSHVKGLALDGGRRPLRVPVTETAVRWIPEEEALLLEFTLPPGSFATTLLDQVMGPGRIAALATRWREERAEAERASAPTEDDSAP